MDEAVVAVMTSPESHAAAIARALPEKKLAACVNLLPQVHSAYWWPGEIEEAGEMLLLVKTTSEQGQAINALLAEAHPYETWELVVLPIQGGNEQYLPWIRESLNT
jgi:periplasmic divalent cation tolerance protein